MFSDSESRFKTKTMYSDLALNDVHWTFKRLCKTAPQCESHSVKLIFAR